MCNLSENIREQERIDVIVKMIKANATKEQIILYGFTEAEYKKAERALYASVLNWFLIKIRNKLQGMLISHLSISCSLIIWKMWIYGKKISRKYSMIYLAEDEEKSSVWVDT